MKTSTHHLLAFLIAVTSLSLGPAMLNLQDAEAGNYRKRLLTLHNRERRKRNRPPLKLSPQLTRAAVKYARVMKKRNHFDHTGPDGSTQLERVQAEGFLTYPLGENIARGDKSVKGVFNGWMRSRGHRRNIRFRPFKYVGFGKAGRYWVANFGGKRR